MIRLLLGDDSILIREILRDFLQGISFVNIVGEADNGIELVRLAKELKPNVIITDIEMPKMNGIEAAEVINAMFHGIIIIFISSYEHYIKEAFKIYAYDYILKPLQYERIIKTINRIYNLGIHRLNVHAPICITNSPEENIKLMVENGGISYMINIQDIVFITRYDRKVNIFSKKGKYSIWTSIEKTEKKLPKYFFRSHKGYIVNINFINEIVPFGKKTYQVFFNECKETALMTYEKLKILKERYYI